MDILKHYGYIFTGSQESILHLDEDATMGDSPTDSRDDTDDTGDESQIHTHHQHHRIHHHPGDLPSPAGHDDTQYQLQDEVISRKPTLVMLGITKFIESFNKNGWMIYNFIHFVFCRPSQPLQMVVWQRPHVRPLSLNVQLPRRRRLWKRQLPRMG